MKVRTDDMIFDVPDGSTYGQISELVQPDTAGQIILVRVNGRLTELSRKASEGETLHFLTTSSDAGFESYRRSLSMLLIKAVYDTAGKENVKRIVLHFTIASGFYFTVDGVTVDEAFTEAVEERMRDLVAMDLPFEKDSLPTSEARRIFREEGMTDKDRLFRFRLVSKTNVYTLGDLKDYFYGFLAHRTGILKYFSVIPYEDGMILQMPQRGAPETVPPFVPRAKLFKAQKEAEEWAARIHLENIGELNERITSGDMADPILLSEAQHEAKFASIAEMIAARPEVKFVMIAGPSSSGKTTSSMRLCIQLAAHGLTPHYIGVDNYFVNRENTPLDENGKKDYECLEAIDIEQFGKDMTALLNGETIKVPTFNFLEGKREYHGETLSLPEHDILVIEGIHCLNDKLSSMLPPEAKFRISINPLIQLNIDEHNRIPRTDGRLLRRIVRDNRTRGHSAAATIAMWDSVRRGEDRNIFPYEESADVFLNSALAYELAVMKPYAEPLLHQIEEGQEEYEEAKRLLKFLSYVIGISSDLVPKNSILREFIGGGCFKI